MNIFRNVRESAKLLRRYFNEAERASNMKMIAYRHTPHFYSPLTDLDYIEENQSKIFANPEFIKDIDINSDYQLQLLINFQEYYEQLPFKVISKKMRYQYKNGFFSYGDAIILYSFLRKLKPKNVIEVGSGYSSAAMLDVNELFFDNTINFTFIEPFPERINSLLRDHDAKKNVLVNSVQEVALEKFDKLNENDILFIDSSHVSKAGSDVNHIIFNILPRLKKGVYIHFHDINWPFEYPKKWVMEGRCWTESYMLRAFLQNNSKYSIQYFNSYMAKQHRESLITSLPLCDNNPGGSIWIKKL